jgi:hypothetical protein
VTDSTLLLMPVDNTPVVELSNTLFRKQILPKGKIKYNGEEIDFNDDFLNAIRLSFQDGALDQVPLQMADTDNKHTMDPSKFSGEIKGLELTATGLDAIIDTPKETADLIRKTGGKLGVSPKIARNRELPNGKSYPAALIHVLATQDPKVVGMEAWQEVKLANETEEEVLDLTNFSYGPAKGKTTKPPVQDPPEDLPELDEDDIALANAIDELLAAEQGRRGTKSGKEDVELSNSSKLQQYIELATRSERERVKALEIELAHSKFETEMQNLIDDGVPPALIELARPVLEDPSSSDIELSNGDKVDVASVMREMLQHAKGYIELGNEQGHTFDIGDHNDEERIQKLWAADLERSGGN